MSKFMSKIKDKFNKSDDKGRKSLFFVLEHRMNVIYLQLPNRCISISTIFNSDDWRSSCWCSFSSCCSIKDGQCLS